jgi:hypothetical protein
MRFVCRHVRIILIIAFTFVFAPGFVLAEPSVSNVSGTVVHGQNITITGNSFGTKSPVAPLMWDDGEGKTVDSDSAILSTGWTDPWPRTDGTFPDCNTRYRNIPFHSTPAPHSHSTEYIAGCHYQEDDNDPAYVGDEGLGAGKYKNVGLTVTGTPGNNWYMNYYYRIDPNWYIPGTDPVNHKITVWNTRSPYSMYDAEVGGAVNYSVYCGNNFTKPSLADAYHNTLQPQGCNTALYANNPLNQWIKIEDMNGSSIGRDMYFDNIQMVHETDVISGIGGASIGGYYRRGSGDTSNFRGGILDSNYRYFDDVYIDNTFSHVILADNQNYNSATIVEPQIPSAWENGAISVTTNLGKFSDTGTVYLFVFDADNNHNAIGYSVTLGGEPDVTAPSAPSGLSVQ